MAESSGQEAEDAKAMGWSEITFIRLQDIRQPVLEVIPLQNHNLSRAGAGEAVGSRGLWSAIDGGHRLNSGQRLAL